VPIRAHSRSVSEITDILETIVVGKALEIAIVREVVDSVLYLGWQAGIRVVWPRQRLSAHWVAPAKCAHWHF
jgi:hypothetical protein